MNELTEFDVQCVNIEFAIALLLCGNSSLLRSPQQKWPKIKSNSLSINDHSLCEFKQLLHRTAYTLPFRFLYMISLLPSTFCRHRSVAHSRLNAVYAPLYVLELYWVAGHHVDDFTRRIHIGEQCGT